VLERGEVVRVAGRGGSVDFLLDQDVPASVLTSELREYLKRSNGWFAGGGVTVHVGRRLLHPDEISQLRAVFEDEHQLKVDSFQCSVENLEAAIAEESGVRVSLASLEKPILRVPVPTPPSTLFVKNNCRSGMVIEHPGDVVIFGDVNPGGQVIAEGDIVVLGILRGTVHAGAKDPDGKDASILAFNLRPAQLRIGSHTYMPPPTKAKRRKLAGPEIAYVRGHAIEVRPFTGRFQSKQERNLL
jgi:septum site-determining protein MinC